MDQLRNIDFSRYLEKAKLYSQENPVHAGAAALAILGSAYLLLCPKRKVNIVPGQNIIVITGCDSGFGLMTSKKLSAMGYLVVAACLQDKSVEALKGVVALPIQCDITKDADVQRLLQKTKELAAAKNARVWAVVNNAGIGNSGNVDLVSSKACRLVMEVNFFALFEVTRAFLPLLKLTKNSRIINISSAAGFTGSYQLGVYCGEFQLITSSTSTQPSLTAVTSPSSLLFILLSYSQLRSTQWRGSARCSDRSWPPGTSTSHTSTRGS